MNYTHAGALLGRPISSPEVRRAFGLHLNRIERDEFYGSISFVEYGFDVVLKQAPWISGDASAIDMLYVAAFHWHRGDHEGFSGYCGDLPYGIRFGDAVGDVERLVGMVSTAGGGQVSKLLGAPTPKWRRFHIAGHVLHVEFDPAGLVQMVTLSVALPS